MFEMPLQQFTLVKVSIMQRGSMNTNSRTNFDCWEEEGLELPIHNNQLMVRQVKTDVVLRGTDYQQVH